MQTVEIIFRKPDKPVGNVYKVRTPDELRDQMQQLSDLSQELGLGHLSIERIYHLCADQVMPALIKDAEMLAQRLSKAE